MLVKEKPVRVTPHAQLLYYDDIRKVGRTAILSLKTGREMET
jgi:hypothetical protein